MGIDHKAELCRIAKANGTASREQMMRAIYTLCTEQDNLMESVLAIGAVLTALMSGVPPTEVAKRLKAGGGEGVDVLQLIRKARTGSTFEGVFIDPEQRGEIAKRRVGY